MARINFRERLSEARNRPAYWIEKIVLDFTVALSSAMRRKNVTGKDLAEKVEVTPAYISKVLNGTPNLTVKSMVQLAHALDLRVTLRVEEASAFGLPISEQTTRTYDSSRSVGGYARINFKNVTSIAGDFEEIGGAVNHAQYHASTQTTANAA
jgi:transcriptional regulator with XRE-family HTH domain